jgi:hypothetical protein
LPHLGLPPSQAGAARLRHAREVDAPPRSNEDGGKVFYLVAVAVIACVQRKLKSTRKCTSRAACETFEQIARQGRELVDQIERRNW